MAKRKQKPVIYTIFSSVNGKPVFATRYERIGDEFRVIDRQALIDEEEQEKFRRKVCKSIGRTVSELPGFQ